MSSKYDDSEEKFFEDDAKDGKEYYSGEKGSFPDPPRVDVTGIEIEPKDISHISAPLSLSIRFNLDRDVVAGYWIVKLLVDSANSRLIQILGETPVEDYVDGESDMRFSVPSIDVSDIPPSTLANSGLLMAIFIVDGEEVASVNLVVNVKKEGGNLYREIFNPLD